MKTALSIASIFFCLTSIFFAIKIKNTQEEYKESLKENISNIQKNNNLLQELKHCKANYESIAEDYFDLPTDYEVK